MSDQETPTDAQVRELRERISAAARDEKLRLQIRLRLQLSDWLTRRGEYDAALVEFDAMNSLTQALSDTNTSPSTKHAS